MTAVTSEAGVRIRRRGLHTVGQSHFLHAVDRCAEISNLYEIPVSEIQGLRLEWTS